MQEDVANQINSINIHEGCLSSLYSIDSITPMYVTNISNKILDPSLKDIGPRVC